MTPYPAPAIAATPESDRPHAKPWPSPLAAIRLGEAHCRAAARAEAAAIFTRVEAGPKARLAERVRDLSHARIAVVGDIMLDRFIYGDVERVSPEAPVPVLLIDQTREMLGGAGNVAANAACLGAGVVLIGLVGQDDAGTAVRKLIADITQVMPAVVSRGNGPTTVKARVVAGHQQIVRLDSELIGAPSRDEAQQILAELGSALRAVDAVLLSDYGKGVLIGDITKEAIRLARDAGRPIIADPKGHDYSIYCGADLITPNLRELHEATLLPVDSDEAVVHACRTLMHDHMIGAVIATRGPQGMSVVTEATTIHLPTDAREVFDVSGAGDTVAATLACAIAVSMPIEEAARLANAAAGVVVGKLGTSQVTPSELANSLRIIELGRSEAKIVSAAEVVEHARSWRAQGLRVGFTNGCFDLLHPGHLALLGQGKAACDRFVVAVNSDESVHRLKGSTRPIQNELSRAAVLASLEMVDRVIIFAEDTPIELIEALHPDTLIKGADYTLNEVVGADFVQRYGGEVLLVELEQGFSTTTTLARVHAAQ
jgi:D-beta-D-heptose 7-phosphate kinase / D-beta-D-heptose 1-phosphate adenosyltransferase